MRTLKRKCVLVSFATLMACSPMMGGTATGGVRSRIVNVEERKPAPPFQLLDGDGKAVALSEYRGRIVLLDFWATWCHGCKEEIPWFSAIEREYGREGVSVIGVSLDGDGWSVVKPFVSSSDLPYKVVLGDDAMAKKYSIGSMPDTFLIDRKGRVAAFYGGVVDREDIEEKLRTLLRER